MFNNSASGLPAGSLPAHSLEPAGIEGGVCGASDSAALDLPKPQPPRFVPLDPFLYRDMRWCERCEREEEIRDVLECAAGRVRVCLGCGRVTLAEMTREVCA